MKGLRYWSAVLMAGLLISCSAAQRLPNAAYSGDLEQVKRLIAQGANPHQHDNRYGRTAIHMAAMQGYLDIIKYLLSQGVEVQTQDTNGLTALHLAVWKGRLASTKYLVSQGADINGNRNKGKFTPLHISVIANHTDIAEWLLTASAGINAKTSSGKTPQNLAAEYRRHEIIDLFRQYEKAVLSR